MMMNPGRAADLEHALLLLQTAARSAMSDEGPECLTGILASIAGAGALIERTLVDDEDSREPGALELIRGGADQGECD